MAGSNRGVTDGAHQGVTDGGDRDAADGRDDVETSASDIDTNASDVEISTSNIDTNASDVDTSGSDINDREDEPTTDEPAGLHDTAVSRSDSRIALGTASTGAIASLAGCADRFELGEETGDDSTGDDGDGSTGNGTGEDDSETEDRSEPDADSERAIGRGARLRHPGAVVIGDSSAAEIASRGPNEVRSQSPIYAPTFETTSTRTAKTDLRLIDPDAALQGVASVPIHTWRFTDVEDGRHVGPMAEAFTDHVRIDDPADSIATVDADGVILASIGALAARMARSNDRLRTELETLDERIAALESRLVTLQTE